MNDRPARHIKRLGLLLVVLAVLLALVLLRHSRPRKTMPQTTPRGNTSAGQQAAKNAGGGAGPGHPSIVLISLDTLRPDHVGCYGYTRNTTPNLDRFARDAVRFSDARCQAPWTLLSHMSLFTSRLPSHNSVDTIASVLPDDVPTLAQLLAQGGYETAGVVNNGQMQKRWGFDRGFKTWLELPEGPAGTCNLVTDQALAWLNGEHHAPYFLFVHYFDAHAPYHRPQPFAQAMGSMLSPEEIQQLLVQRRFLDDGPVDPALLTQVIGAYDGAINWMDHELGRLLAAIPPDVGVVVFSDHGEAFREHGYFVHGSTVFDEEVRTVLLMRLPGQSARVVDAPVALLDVAPTLLALGGLSAPQGFEGQDLLPLIHGEAARPRSIPAEIRLPVQRTAVQGVVMGEWKGVVSSLDGSRQLFHLPDEVHDRAAESPAAGVPLFEFLDTWASERDYWVLYARGARHYEVTVQPREGMLTAVIPSDQSHEGDHDDVPPESPQSVVWKPAPGAKVKMLYVQLSHPESELHISVAIDGLPAPDALTLPAAVAPTTASAPAQGARPATSRPVVDQPAKLEHDGVLAVHYRGSRASGRPATIEALDAETQERLRSLGYIR